MIPQNSIICGENLAVLRDFPANFVDLVVTSPPYGDLRQYNGARVVFKKLAGEMFRVISPGGVLVWVVKDASIKGDETGTSFRQALYFKKIGFRLYDTMIYLKTGISHPTPGRYHDVFEYMFVFSKGKPKTINLLKDRKNVHLGSRSGRIRQTDDSLVSRSSRFVKPVGEVGLRYNVWLYNTGFNLSTKDECAFEHPAIFPEDLAADHIRTWSNPGDVVLDPMNGSGTTTKMAAKLNRRYIGIDISEKYCEIAHQRLEAVDTGVPVKEQKAGQLALFR